MKLLWIFLLVFNGYVANAKKPEYQKEECSPECVVFNFPYILCAPDLSKVSVTPFCEYMTQGEHCKIECCKPKPFKETHKPVGPPKTENPEIINKVIYHPPPKEPPPIDNPPKEPPPCDKPPKEPPPCDEPPKEPPPYDKPPKEPPPYDNPPKEPPPYDKPPKEPPPCDKPPKEPPPYVEPPEFPCFEPHKSPCKFCCVPRELQIPILQNAPTSSYLYPDFDCGCYPPFCVNPRYFRELASLYNRPCNNAHVVSCNQKFFDPSDQVYLGKKSSPINLDYESRPVTVQDEYGYPNVPNEELQFSYNKHTKDHALTTVPSKKDNFVPPFCCDRDYMYKCCSPYPLPPKPEPKPHCNHGQHPHNPYPNHQQPDKPQHKPPPYSTVDILSHDKEIKPPTAASKPIPSDMQPDMFDISFLDSDYSSFDETPKNNVMVIYNNNGDWKQNVAVKDGKTKLDGAYKIAMPPDSMVSDGVTPTEEILKAEQM